MPRKLIAENRVNPREQETERQRQIHRETHTERERPCGLQPAGSQGWGHPCFLKLTDYHHVPQRLNMELLKVCPPEF